MALVAPSSATRYTLDDERDVMSMAAAARAARHRPQYRQKSETVVIEVGHGVDVDVLSPRSSHRVLASPALYSVSSRHRNIHAYSPPAIYNHLHAAKSLPLVPSYPRRGHGGYEYDDWAPEPATHHGPYRDIVQDEWSDQRRQWAHRHGPAESKRHPYVYCFVSPSSSYERPTRYPNSYRNPRPPTPAPPPAPPSPPLDPLDSPPSPSIPLEQEIPPNNHIIPPGANLPPPPSPPDSFNKEPLSTDDSSSSTTSTSTSSDMFSPPLHATAPYMPPPPVPTYMPMTNPMPIPMAIPRVAPTRLSADSGSSGSSDPISSEGSGRSVRWRNTLVSDTPPPQRRKGWFNKRGDQLWTNAGGYVEPKPGMEYPPDLVGYPEKGTGWMNEEGVVIDMKHRLVPKKPVRSALKRVVDRPELQHAHRPPISI